jgi:uncharacterized membrane protein
MHPTGGAMSNGDKQHHLRFHLPFANTASAFGDDWYGEKAEAFSRIFGTPQFLIVQSLLIAAWIVANVVGLVEFDPYPFILMNLVFSLQAAYAAPLILLAQTRQADRDNAHAEADALHMEALALASEQRELLAGQQAEKLLVLMEQNTRLTEIIKDLSEHIEKLTTEIHSRTCTSDK